MEKNIKLNLKKENIKDIEFLQGLQLAYIGDSIYDILAREYIMKTSISKIKDLHQKVSEIVRATSQSKFAKKLLEKELLNKEEISIFRRGKNQKINTKAKNATIIEYKNATGLEAVFGYLYLKKDFDRLEEIFTNIIEEYEKGKN
ncbi:Mini-ribonuclease 3 [Gemelliphila asaccharolytica]|uniref:Mini-ribonuclease 3 n=1 Tax=Gemelliphila asaccharolytica TaxID=502393 RepID=A0ABR5TMA1_9BACL|nr:ribonuclease III domain-containing protein [Gemella asaccharolytica]KXB58410.1 RNase3 domain protein [Gemella asaccharolytica]